MRDLPRLPLRPLSSLSLMVFAAVAHAQTEPPAASGTPPATTLAPIFVTANPLGDNELIAPTAQLSGDALTRRQADSLGETPKRRPGRCTTPSR
ncbi:TonB-dependent receptor, partial [Burkholderia contaminans]